MHNASLVLHMHIWFPGRGERKRRPYRQMEYLNFCTVAQGAATI